MGRGAHRLTRAARRASALAAALAVGGAIGHAPAAEREPAGLTVFAAASLTEVFEDLGNAFTRRTGTTVSFNFAGSHQLAAQLELGARADVFAPADDRWMRRIVDLGLAAGEPAVFAHNHLVVIAPAGVAARVRSLDSLVGEGLRLVLPADAVPAGRYARRAIAALAEMPGAPPAFERRVLANLVSEEEGVRGVVAKVLLGEADAGIVYRSDVTPAIAPRVTVLPLPPHADVLAAYPIVVLAGAREPAQARAFVELVLSEEGRTTLARHGFEPPRAP